MNYTIEVCANSVQSALNAQTAGAHRVELCGNLWEAGTTPSHGVIKKARELLEIDVFVLIRPRGGDFVYSNLELEVMKEDIQACKAMGVNGIVSGALHPDNTIDMDKTQQLIACSKPLPFTFHRAFDLTPDLSQLLNTLITLGAQRVLTSGGQNKAANACTTLAQLHQLAQDKIIVLPGGGINQSNIQDLVATGCVEFHLTGNAPKESPAQPHHLRLNGTTDIPECSYLESSVQRLKAVVDLLQQ